MKILVAQINPTIGDLKGNTARIIEMIHAGRKAGATIVLFPELALTGYPPEDFLLLPHFIQEVQAKLAEIVEATEGICAIVGMPRPNPNRKEKGLYNSAAVISNKKLAGFQDKILLPTYDVFDERRYFESGNKVHLWRIAHKRVAITICEDLWQHSQLVSSTSYHRDPIAEIKSQQPDLVLNLSASPYSLAKFHSRLQACQRAATSLGCPLILCNQVGGNDQLIFDGYSVAISANGAVRCAKGFAEDAFLVDLEDTSSGYYGDRHTLQDLYQALVMGVRDYFRKSNFKRACLGLSGGIDSALVACIAAEALGPENILTVNMPSRYSSDHSKADASLLAKRLKTVHQEISIEEPFSSYLTLLSPHFEGKKTDTTEENIQARIRGMILMALSNKLGYIVLSTGNKSELALGYSTLYGDMCGGLAVISDLTKEQVYALAHWVNRREEIIPESTIQKPPSAELRENQKDSDSLPDYAIIDRVLHDYVELHLSPEIIAAKNGYPLALVQDLVKRIHQNEYKRRQSPPGLRVSEKSFSVGRHFPIVQGWI